MADRSVTKTDKDEDGEILALRNPWADWGRCSKALAIGDTENGVHQYYVEIGNKEVYT